jgi:ribosomal protein S18 acetylase RimI-like enzyme
MIIERAKASDAEEILSLQKLAYISEAEIYNDFTISPLVQTLNDTKNDFRRQIFLKATINGKIIGSVRAFAKEGTCYIGKLIVHPDFQNQGIGTKLLNEIESLFKTCRRFELFTGNKSEKNIYLYQKIGYRIFKSERSNDNLTFVYLEKSIGETNNE